MKKIILLIAISVLFSCISPERAAIRQEIIASAPGVTTHMPNSAQWCKAEQQCQYLRNLKCGGTTETECVSAMQRDTVKLGGDTVVIQEIKPYLGSNRGKILVYGQAYNCADKFTGIGSRYQVTNPTRLKKVRYLSVAYAKKCGTETKCKSIAPFECSELNYNPARLCLRTLDTMYPDAGLSNTLVFEKEDFSEREDNGNYQRGMYQLSGQVYNCSLE